VGGGPSPRGHQPVRGEGLGNEKSGPAIPRDDDRGVVKKWTGVEHAEDLGVRMANAIASGAAELIQDARQLTASATMKRLKKPPVPARR